MNIIHAIGLSLMLALVVAISGCAAPVPDTTAQQQQLQDTVEFIRPYELSRTDVSFTSLGAVAGESCQAHFWNQEPSQQQALLQLKQAAAEFGANALVLKQCIKAESAQCRLRWLCEGDAYQMQPLN
ncbi:Rcs stress response system protein RcsF [Pseudidiomarina sp. WS423]|uniref:Rcs stress response system protein RcsF n=1 Tax=Pseudidiomarina sp. WS423 TaxID=3425124 RepID=UPI003D6EA665